MDFQDDNTEIENEIEVEGEEASLPEPEPEVVPDNQSDDFQADDEEEEKPKGRLPAKKRISQLTREKYRYQDELRREREEKVALTARLSQMEEVINKTYGDKIAMQLEAARKQKVDAINNSDADELIKADEAIARAAYAEEELKREMSQRQYLQQNQQQDYRRQEEQFYQKSPELAEVWRDTNTWFNEDSDDYDPELSEYTRHKDAELANYYRSQGYEQAIGSPAYFQQLDGMVRSAAELKRFQQPRQPEQRKTLSMKKPNTPVSGVRGGGYAPARPGAGLKMSAEQAAIADAFAEAMGKEPGTTRKSYMAQAIKLERDGTNAKHRNNLIGRR
jgi:vacuolar-type H+-ATPase subunit I/STV1